VTKPCTHRRRSVFEFEARAFFVGSFERWRVLERLRCVRCGEESRRWSRKGNGAASAREALKRYGAPTEDLPAPKNHKVKPPIEVPLTGWPFKTSAHEERP
jgi:hypothetical protein